MPFAYCILTSGNSDDEFISNVKITAEGASGVNSTSAGSNYTDFSTDPSRLVKLVKGTNDNTISVTKSWPSTQYSDAVTVWIDFDRSGTYEAGEMIMATAPDKITPVTGIFSVPENAYTGNQTVGMRVALRYNTSQIKPCGTFSDGEVEDYAVKISPIDTANVQILQVYPNPSIDVLNITKVSDKATYSIVNMAGRVVSKGKVLYNKVQVSQLVKGVYIISLDDGGEVGHVKFIKK